jgi:chromosomal replication initiator protein
MTQPAGQDDAVAVFHSPNLQLIECVQAENDHRISVTTSSCVADPVDHDVIGEIVRNAVGDQNFEHWFLNRTRIVTTGDRMLVYVANPFILNWLLKRFRSQLTVAAQNLLGPSGACHLEVDNTLTVAGEKKVSPVDLPGDTPSSLIGKIPENGPCADDTASEKARSFTSASNPFQSGKRRFRSFATLITGDCNSLAVLAAQQVSASPGERFNPLYIHGATGTGKTHLLEAIYTEVRRRRPQSTVMYLNSEAFTNYFTAALSSRTVPSFRQRFRNVDVLLIDNIEFLDNKRATQEEFLHTIVQVAEHGGQVVVSSDRHPRLLTRHREELTTRFMSGLVCKVENPDEETCRRIVRAFAGPLSARFTDDVIEYIARRCRRNVREIQGALNSLDGHFSLSGSRITLNVARDILGDLDRECRRLVRITDVEKIVCEAFGVTAAELRSASRRRTVSIPRSVAMFLARRHTSSAYREIGLHFGGRDHSTVVAAEKRVAELIRTGENLMLRHTCTGSTMAEIMDELEVRLGCVA